MNDDSPTRRRTVSSTASQSAPHPTFESLSKSIDSVGEFVSPRAISVATGLALLSVAVAPAAATQGEVGGVYCDTGVATGIDLVFSAVAGLGLPATGFYTGKAGISYMRAGGNPEKKNAAKEKLLMSGMGFGIVTLALVSPELIDKVGSQMGFGFSDCVKPY